LPKEPAQHPSPDVCEVASFSSGGKPLGRKRLSQPGGDVKYQHARNALRWNVEAASTGKENEGKEDFSSRRVRVTHRQIAYGALHAPYC
jgi:hypothetical protein